MISAEEERFRAFVIASWDRVFKAARYFHSRGGLAVRIGPLMIRPENGRVEDYGDDHDLAIQSKGSDKWWRIEVKGRELNFTCADDYPFQTIFLDRSKKADVAEPHAYFILNKAMTHAAIIKTSTKAQWGEPRMIEDNTKLVAYAYPVYECPKHLAEFVVL